MLDRGLANSRLAWANRARQLASVLTILLLWETASRTGFYNAILFPPPSRIAATFAGMLRSGEWFRDVGMSMTRYAVGYALGCVLGVLFGAATGRIPFVRTMLTPIFNYLRSTPSIALVPLAIVWFGIGEAQKVFVIAWGVTFPVWLNAHIGMSRIEREYDWAARSLGLVGWRLYRNVYLPRALPFIIAGARIGIATAFFALAAAEMAGAFGGIAFRIFFSHQMFQTDHMMVAILTIGGLGLVLDKVFTIITRRLVPWWTSANTTDDQS